VFLTLTAATLIAIHFSNSLQGSDFPDFYCAARMFLEGHGHQLYDAGLQRQYQSVYAARVGTLYIHPPFEILFYLPVAWLSLRHAYLLWSVLNLFLLVVASHKFARTLPRWNWQLPFVASLTFVPTLLCISQGQDSLLLLLFVVFAFTALQNDRPFTSGCWLALALIKFQLALPLALLLFLTQDRARRIAFAKGFTLITAVLVAASVAISGWSVLIIYPHFLIQLPAEPFAGIMPHAMANFRGLIYIVFRDNHSPWIIAIVFLLSAGAFARAFSFEKKQNAQLIAASNHAESHSNLNLHFSAAVLVSLLVSYHLNPHDLVLLLLPIALLLNCTLSPTPQIPALKRRAVLCILALLFLPPLHLWALKIHLYPLISILILALFLIVTPAHANQQALPN
jgi:hypothetical protein